MRTYRNYTDARDEANETSEERKRLYIRATSGIILSVADTTHGPEIAVHDRPGSRTAILPVAGNVFLIAGVEL